MPVLAAIFPVAAAAFPILFGLADALLATLLTFGASQLLAKKPKRQQLGFDDRTTTGIDPTAPMDVVFGEVRKGGRVIYNRNSADKHDKWVVIALAGHRVKEIGACWVGDELVFPSPGDGSVDHTFASKLFIWKHLGEDDQDADANLKAAFPDDWTDNHRLRGIAYVVVKYIYDSALYARGVPNISCFVRGYDAVYDPRTGATGYSDNPILCARAWLRDTRFGLRAAAHRIDDAAIAREADWCDEMINLAPRYEIGCIGDRSKTFTVSTSTDLLTISSNMNYGKDHGLIYNDPVRVSTTTTLPSPLVAGTTYYARPLTQTTLQLAAAKTDSAVINITTTGSGTHTIVGSAWRMEVAGSVAEIDAVMASDELGLEESLVGGTLPSTFGARVYLTATKFRLATADSLASPLQTNTDYYAIRVDDNTLQVATTVANAEAGTQVNITTEGTNDTIRFIGLGGSFTADASTDVVTLLEDKYFQAGDVVIPQTTGTLPAPLVAGDGYFWIRVTATTGKLAASRWQALIGEAIDLTDAGTGAHAIFADRMQQDEIRSMPTGTVVQLTAGTIGDPLALNTDYYVINRGGGLFDLAASPADAFADDPIVTTTGHTTARTIAFTRTKERRYSCNGVLDCDNSYGEVLKALLSSCAGAADPGGGKWRFLAGRYRPPAIVLDGDDMRAGAQLTLQTRLPRRSAINRVSGTYTSPLYDDEPANFPTLTDTDALAEDGGEVLEQDVVLAFTNSKEMASRLSKIILRRGRRPRHIEFPTDLAAAWLLAVGDSCRVDIPAIGQNGRTYEVEGWKLAFEAGDQGAPLPVVDLTLRETEPNVYR